MDLELKRVGTNGKFVKKIVFINKNEDGVLYQRNYEDGTTDFVFKSRYPSGYFNSDTIVKTIRLYEDRKLQYIMAKR